MSDHGQSGHCDHHHGDAEILVALAELFDRRALIRIVHEVHKALQDLRAELQNILYRPAVLGILLHLEHVHECAVVDPVHTEGAHEVTLHQPESLG